MELLLRFGFEFSFGAFLFRWVTTGFNPCLLVGLSASPTAQIVLIGWDELASSPNGNEFGEVYTWHLVVI